MVWIAQPKLQSQLRPRTIKLNGEQQQSVGHREALYIAGLTLANAYRLFAKYGDIGWVILNTKNTVTLMLNLIKRIQ